MFSQFGQYRGNLVPDPPPDPPTREKKIPFEFTFKHLVIFMVLFILMLVVLYVVETTGKASREAGKTSREAEWQKRQTAKDFCLTNGLNFTYAELDNCIEVSLALSEALDATETSQSRATEISRWSAAQISQIRHRAAEASQMSAVSQQAALCESRGEHYRYREGACQLRVWVCTESQTSTGYEEECKYEWRDA